MYPHICLCTCLYTYQQATVGVRPLTKDGNVLTVVCRYVYRHALQHKYRHVDRHAYRHVYGSKVLITCREDQML